MPMYRASSGRQSSTEPQNHRSASPICAMVPAADATEEELQRAFQQSTREQIGGWFLRQDGYVNKPPPASPRLVGVSSDEFAVWALRQDWSGSMGSTPLYELDAGTEDMFSSDSEGDTYMSAPESAEDISMGSHSHISDGEFDDEHNDHTSRPNRLVRSHDGFLSTPLRFSKLRDRLSTRYNSQLMLNARRLEFHATLPEERRMHVFPEIDSDGFILSTSLRPAR